VARTINLLKKLFGTTKQACGSGFEGSLPEA